MFKLDCSLKQQNFGKTMELFADGHRGSDAETATILSGFDEN